MCWLGSERERERERERKGEHEWRGRAEWDTFGGIGSLVLAPVAEDFIFDPGHVVVVGFVVLVFGPLGHDGGMMAAGCLVRVELLLER